VGEGGGGKKTRGWVTKPNPWGPRSPKSGEAFPEPRGGAGRAKTLFAGAQIFPKKKKRNIKFVKKKKKKKKETP